MQKGKVLILTGVIGVVASLSLLLGTGASNPIKFDGSTLFTFNMKEKFNGDKIPPGFEVGANPETAKKLDLSTSVDSNQNGRSKRSATPSRKLKSIESLTVNQELRKDGDYFVGSGGSIELSIEGKNRNLTILSSLVSHFKLKNGNNLMTGSFEAEMKDDKGNLVPSTVSFASIIETGERFFNVVMGTLEEGPVVLTFGDDSFGTQEIRDIVRGQANIEGDKL